MRPEAFFISHGQHDRLKLPSDGERYLDRELVKTHPNPVPRRPTGNTYSIKSIVWTSRRLKKWMFCELNEELRDRERRGARVREATRIPLSP
jgi:hypothetical protein